MTEEERIKLLAALAGDDSLVVVSSYKGGGAAYMDLKPLKTEDHLFLCGCLIAKALDLARDIGDSIGVEDFDAIALAFSVDIRKKVTDAGEGITRSFGSLPDKDG